MNRRRFLQSSAALAGSLGFLPLPTGTTQAAIIRPRTLTIDTRSLDIDGRDAKVYGLTSNGLPGLAFAPGDAFEVELQNRLVEPTIIHWHGLTPPVEQDGVPNAPLPMLEPGANRSFAFPLRESGSYWMHAHTLQHQNLLSAPLIVHSKEDLAADLQEVVMLLHDFSFRPAAELLDGLTGGKVHDRMKHGGMNHADIDHSGMQSGESGMDATDLKSMDPDQDKTDGGTMDMGEMNMGGTDMSGMEMGGMERGGMEMGGMDMATMDLNDIEYDAYLANDRTLGDPEVVRVDRTGRVRLRIINGAASTAFSIATGSLQAGLVAVDGQPVQQQAGALFPLTMGQRIDLIVSIPPGGGAFPILALREGAPERAGIVLATAGAPIPRIPIKGDRKGPVLSLADERNLRPIDPLATRKPDHQYMVHLTGDMATYRWGLMGAEDLVAHPGERVEIAMMNMSMMAHPMHLHGHRFQVVGIDGERFYGALRDTVLVPPMKTVTIAFDAGSPGRWAFHCHHLYHMASGMMGFVNVG